MMSHRIASMKQWLSGIRIPVYVLFILFGISSWINMDAVRMELPFMLNQLPEGWRLPSYVVMTSQVANVGPMVYVIAHRFLGSRIMVPTIYTILALGAMATTLLAFLWQQTTNVNGLEHSTALLALQAVLAVLDCTSTVVFLSYMARFQPQYLTGLYIGEGLCGMIPALISFLQGNGLEAECIFNNNTSNYSSPTSDINSGDTYPDLHAVYPEPAFSVRTFLLITALLIVISGISFTLLQKLPYCRREHRNQTSLEMQTEHTPIVESSNEEIMSNGLRNQTDASNNTLNLNSTSEKVHKVANTCTTSSEISKGEFVYIVCLTGWACILANTTLPSIAPYASLPYGQTSYVMSVRLVTLANPLASLVALFLPTRSLVTISIHTLLGTLAMVYQLYLASVSPCPPLKHTEAGIALNVSTQYTVHLQI